MDRETLLGWLALSERHVEQGARHILEQRELLSRLQKPGQGKSDTAGIASDLLDEMERLQALHIAHRDHLVDALKR
jgi:DNA repair protein RadC